MRLFPQKKLIIEGCIKMQEIRQGNKKPWFIFQFKLMESESWWGSSDEGHQT